MMKKHGIQDPSTFTGMERVAARIGDGGLDVGFYLSNTDSLHARANRLFSQSLAQVNGRVLEANDVDCIMDGEMPVEELGIPFEEIPERMQAEVSTEYDKFIVAMHLVSNAGESPEVYYYHGDHLGSASWITDGGGQAIQHLQYLPYGEPYINQRTSGYNERFTFTGKERDEETGYGYFGARYMDYELITMWLSVDPMADKYPSISPYAYCAWNPVKLVDPDGMDLWKPEVYRNGDVSYKKEPGDNASTLQKQYGLSANVAQQLYGTMKNGRISGKSVARLNSGNQILKVDWKKTTDHQKIYQAFFAILHGIVTGQGAEADMNNYFDNLPSQEFNKKMLMGVSDHSVDIRGDISLPLMDGKEVYAKYASLAVTKETSRIGCPQQPTQVVPNRADSDWRHHYTQVPGNIPRLFIRIDNDNFERYSRDYYR